MKSVFKRMKTVLNDRKQGLSLSRDSHQVSQDLLLLEMFGHAR